MIPNGLRIHLRRWARADLHNRFVLTELGGVAFLEGLDHYAGDGRKEDVVVLLDWDVSQQLIDNYTLGKTTFKLIDEHVVVGNREFR